MTARILDGKKVAAELEAEIALKVRLHSDLNGTCPVLTAVLVGEDPASQVYVRHKRRACQRVGIESRLLRLDSGTSINKLLDVIAVLNADSSVNGILVQLPLPDNLDTQQVLDAVDSSKDVDAFHPLNVGLISQGRPRFLPCTPHGILRLLGRYDIRTRGKHVAIIGRSEIVGKPLAMMLAARDVGLGPDLANATVTLCHSQTTALAETVRAADIVIAAIGSPNFVTGDMIKPGAVVIDVGINRTEAGLVGDVEFESAARVASHITPVPGGVGPLTVTMLLKNTLAAAQQSRPAGE